MIVLVPVVVVLVAAGVVQHAMFRGRYSAIAKPCALSNEAAVASLVRKPGPPEETPGRTARCRWPATSVTNTGVRYVRLDLWSEHATAFTSATSQARRLFDAQWRTLHGSSVPGLGDEAVRQPPSLLLVRSDNLVWTLSIIGGTGAGGPYDALLTSAREIQSNLRDLRRPAPRRTPVTGT